MPTMGYKWNNGIVFDLLGKDVYSWLQGQITQDINKASFERFTYFCFCNINGHIEGVGILLKIVNGARIILDTKDIHFIEQRLDSIILEDIKLERKKQSPILGFGVPPKKGEFFILEQPCWGEWITFDKYEGCWLNELEWKKKCLLNKMPFWEVDIKEKTFPVELGISFDQLYVNYKKGCYIGQEILMRLHTKGNPRRQWMVFKTTILLKEILDHPLQLKGLEITSCIPNTSHDYLCGIYVHRNIYNQSSDVLILNDVGQVIGVRL